MPIDFQWEFSQSWVNFLSKRGHRQSRVRQPKARLGKIFANVLMEDLIVKIYSAMPTMVCIPLHMYCLSFRIVVCNSQGVQYYKAKSHWADSAIASDSHWLLHKWVHEYDYILPKGDFYKFALRWRSQEHVDDNPDSNVHGANMGPTWVLSAPDGPHVSPMNLAIREVNRVPGNGLVLKASTSLPTLLFIQLHYAI